MEGRVRFRFLKIIVLPSNVVAGIEPGGESSNGKPRSKSSNPDGRPKVVLLEEREVAILKVSTSKKEITPPRVIASTLFIEGF